MAHRSGQVLRAFWSRLRQARERGQKVGKQTADRLMPAGHGWLATDGSWAPRRKEHVWHSMAAGRAEQRKRRGECASVFRNTWHKAGGAQAVDWGRRQAGNHKYLAVYVFRCSTQSTRLAGGRRNLCMGKACVKKCSRETSQPASRHEFGWQRMTWCHVSMENANRCRKKIS